MKNSKLETFINLQSRNVTDDESNTSSSLNSNSGEEINKLDKIIDNKHKSIFKDTEFLDIDKINKKKFSELYNILISSQMIIFVDNYKLNKVKKCKFKPFRFLYKKSLIDENFPGCIFLPYDYKQTLITCLNKINQAIIKSELNRSDLKDNYNEKYYCICFDDGEISKNIVYKRLEIRNKLLFIPINKFQLKLTEYRIR